MTDVPVTLIIPTHNGGPLFQQVLRAVRDLDPKPRRVLVVDSESTDGTDRVAADSGVEVLRIRKAEFDHGATRQSAVERSETELVAFLSQDALPASDYLGELAQAFCDARVAGATARVLPFADSSALARRTVLASPQACDEPATIEVDPLAFRALDPADRRARCRFDNVASMARRQVLIEHPFPRTMMGEDIAFAEAALLAGYRLVHVPSAVVQHAHEYGPVAAFRRYRDDARWVRTRFGEQVRRSIFSALKGVAYEVREDARYLAGRRKEGSASARGYEVREWARSPVLRGAQVFGQWWGSVTRAAS